MRTDGNVHPSGDHRSIEPSGGITLREHFAGLAMQGLISNKLINSEWIAKRAAEIADALIAELNKPIL